MHIRWSNMQLGKHTKGCIKRFCEETGSHLWRGACKSVMSKTKGKSSLFILYPRLLYAIHWSYSPNIKITHITPENFFTAKTVEIRTQSQSSVLIKSRTRCLCWQYYTKDVRACIHSFPKGQSESERLMLISKLNKLFCEPSVYRPICLLNTTGKADFKKV